MFFQARTTYPAEADDKRAHGSNLLVELPVHFQDGTELVTELFVSAGLNTLFCVTKEQYQDSGYNRNWDYLANLVTPALLWVLWHNPSLVFALLLFVSQKRL